MKKLVALLNGLFFLSFQALAQGSQELQGLSKSTYEDALNHSNVTAILASPEFQLALTIVILLALGSWLFYFWISFYLGQHEGEGSVQKLLQELFSPPTKTSKKNHLPAPDLGEVFSSLPRLDIHIGSTPLMAAGHEKSGAPTDRNEKESPHGRGD